MDERKTANYWLLITALNTAKFAIVELNPDTMKMQHKQQFKMLQNAMHSFLSGLQGKASKEDKELLNNMNFENVAALAETFGLISQIPEPQIEWFLEQCNRLVFAAVNRELEKNT